MIEHLNTSLNHSEMWFYDCEIHVDQDSQRIALFLLNLLLFMASLVENILVVWVNWRRRHSASGVIFCIINISLSDLMVVFTMPFFMLENTMDQVWLWGHFLCKVTHLIYVINFYSSSFFLAFMTLERYLSLTRPSKPSCFPLQPRHKRWFMCAGVWLLSILLAALENVHVKLLEWDVPGCYVILGPYDLEWFVSISFLCLIFQFLGPASVIITGNVLIARAMRACPDVENRRDLWLVHVYSLVFVMCWLPYHIVTFLMLLDSLNLHMMSCRAVEMLYFSFSIVQCLSTFHCVANPILYNFLSKSFRAKLVAEVVSCIAAAPGSSAVDGAGTAQQKERKLSNASTSTSYSEMGS